MVTTNETRLKRFRTTKQSVLSAAVPSSYSIRRGKPTDSDCSRIALADAYDSLSTALRRHPKPSRRGLAAIRTHCPSPSAVGARAQTDDPVPADPQRPVLLGLALSFVARLCTRTTSEPSAGATAFRSLTRFGRNSARWPPRRRSPANAPRRAAAAVCRRASRRDRPPSH